MKILIRFRVLGASIAALIVGGCSAQHTMMSDESEPLIDRDYAFFVEDIPAEQRFKLILEARSSRLICTSNRRWPTEAGRMENASDKVFVVVDNRKFAYKDFDMDVCPFKACGNPMNTGMRVEASLFYRDFDLPKNLYDAPKVLLYDPQPFWCDNARWIDGRPR